MPIRSRAGLAGHHLLGSVFGGRPVPLWAWMAARPLARVLFSGPDPLSPSNELLASRGDDVQVSELQQILSGEQLGVWSLDRFAITELWHWMQKSRPRVILECGAGVSTLVFAKFAASGGEACRVISIEQEPRVKEQVQQKLAGWGLGSFVSIIHVPVGPDGMYELTPGRAHQILGATKVHLLFIDGPAGPEACRANTLPSLAAFCARGARWFLDDALRDGELSSLRAWARMPGIRVEGILPIGKGLATGLARSGA